MIGQYVYNQAPGQQIYNTDQVLFQYNIGSNPYDPLGLKGTNYTFDNSSNQSSQIYSTKSERVIILNHNRGYTQQIVYGQPTHLQKDYNSAQYYQKQTGQNLGNEGYVQAANLQLQKQPQFQQNIVPQYQYNYQNQQIQIQPQQNMQQNLQYLQYPQLLQYQAQQKQLTPHTQIKPQQVQIKPKIQNTNKNVQQKVNNKNQLKVKEKPQQKITQPKIQQQNASHNIISKEQKPKTNPAQKHYHQNTQNKNQKTQASGQNKVNIENEQFRDYLLNKQIYADNNINPTSFPNINPKEIKKLDNNQNEQKVNLPVTNNIPQPIQQPIIEKKTSDKCNPNISGIKEEEKNIEQSGLSKKISQINVSNNSIEGKEFPMEEKKPEAAFPENLMGVNKLHNISEKSITESTISDMDSKLDHLPTLNSILRGNSEPLPPSKKKKYK